MPAPRLPPASLDRRALPHTAPARVLAFGAFLKNRACLVVGEAVLWSPLHGDLGTPAACAALATSAEALLAAAGGRIDAVAHDLHPDFFSTRLARQTAARLGVPALAVQHHHAHLGVVQAEQGWRTRAIVGLALDGVGLGSDGTAWGGEVLRVHGAECTRAAHLAPLALPGGDIAAREPWRLVAAVLHASGRAAQIEPRLAPQVGTALARGVAAMLARDLNCPRTTSAGRWFDAAAGALGLSTRQSEEGEAARALEAAATAWLRDAGPAQPRALRDRSAGGLDLLPLVASLLGETDGAAGQGHGRGDCGLDGDLDGDLEETQAGDPAARHARCGRGAAHFHIALAQGLVAAAARAASEAGTRDVALGGGCFFNRLLAAEVQAGLDAAGLRPRLPHTVDPGDAGLALGQAWAAGLRLRAGGTIAPARQRAALAEED